MVTIRDVAREAGVSTATVSRVLGRPDLVTPETRASVLAAIETLGYTPNAAAKSLRTLRSGKVLVTVPDIANPFFALILQGIESAALRAGYSVLLGDTQHDDKREQQYALMLQRREADGLIFLGHRLPKAAAALVRSRPRGQAPVVNGCEFSPGLGVPSVHIDNARAAFEAVDHLSQLGHRHIGVVTGPMASPLSRDRLKGAMARASRDGPASPSGRRRRLLDRVGHRGRRPAAVGAKAADRHLLLQRRDGDRRRARRAPARMAGAASPFGGRLRRHPLRAVPHPPLTTIRQPMRELGEATVRLLLNILRGNVKDAVSVTLPHALMVRASTAAPRSRAAGAARG